MLEEERLNRSNSFGENRKSYLVLEKRKRHIYIYSTENLKSLLKMSSTILYKFRAQTNFEQISLPGSSARLFDIKRAIVAAKKLDKTGGMQIEFDLSVRNAMTEEEYTDENMLLPRGTRVIVQRLPAAKGQGILARIARADAGMSTAVTARYGNQEAANGGFYTIESHKDDDEFISSTNQPSQSAAEEENSEEKELAALKAATEKTGGSVYSSSSHAKITQPIKVGPAGMIPPPPSFGKPQSIGFQQHSGVSNRPNADPELREQERLAAQAGQPKKRATGIPRTFLSISAPPVEGEEKNDEEAGSGAIKLQPNTIAFEALINRGGGQSGSGGRALDLDYALKLTATEIPEHLQCGICGQVVKNAMLVPWDPEGRTTCEMCMRDGLAKNAFRCPLTGNEGVSPDDLLPNVGLRKAVDIFVKDVFEKMNEIIQAQEAEDEAEKAKAVQGAQSKKVDDFEGDSLDKGVVLGRKDVTGSSSQKRRRDMDEFGDEFGGDVFDVEPEDVEEEDESAQEEKQNDHNNNVPVTPVENSNDVAKVGEEDTVKSVALSEEKDVNISTDEKLSQNNLASEDQPSKTEDSVNISSSKVHSLSATSNQNELQSRSQDDDKDLSNESSESPTKSRRDLLKNRAPPQGYAMGPAGASDTTFNTSRGVHGGRYADHGGRGYMHGGRGRYPPGGRFDQGRGYHGGRGRGRFPPEGHESQSFKQDDVSIDNQSHQSHGDGDFHTKKRHRTEDSGGRGGGRGDRACFVCGITGHLARDCPESRRGGRGFDHGGRGPPGRGGDWYRGGRGRFHDGGRGRDFGRGGRGGGRWGVDGRGRY